MKTIRTHPRNGAKQVRYVGEPIRCPVSGLDYPLSIWTDGKFRMTNPKTGNITMTFKTLEEVADYRREMDKRHTLSAPANPSHAMNADFCRRLENHACYLIVAFGGGRACRKAVADTIRGWRSIGDHERARWFRKHAFYISGHLFKS